MGKGWGEQDEGKGLWGNGCGEGRGDKRKGARTGKGLR